MKLIRVLQYLIPYTGIKHVSGLKTIQRQEEKNEHQLKRSPKDLCRITTTINDQSFTMTVIYNIRYYRKIEILTSNRLTEDLTSENQFWDSIHPPTI